jgi:hypothetical protein
LLATLFFEREREREREREGDRESGPGARFVFLLAGFRTLWIGTARIRRTKHQSMDDDEERGDGRRRRRHANRLKGILALLPDTVEPLGSASGGSIPTIDLADAILGEEEDDDPNRHDAKTAVVVAILLIDTKQPLSQKLWRKIQQVILLQQDSSATTTTTHFRRSLRLLLCNQRPDVPLTLFYQHHNSCPCYMLPHLGQAGSLLLPGLQSCPGLALVDAIDGRPFGHAQEELGVLWNAPPAILSAWLGGDDDEPPTTCLTPLQQVQAGLLFPTMCTIQ